LRAILHHRPSDRPRQNPYREGVRLALQFHHLAAFRAPVGSCRQEQEDLQAEAEDPILGESAYIPLEGQREEFPSGESSSEGELGE